jgi:hypothetical protein
MAPDYFDIINTTLSIIPANLNRLEILSSVFTVPVTGSYGIDFTGALIISHSNGTVMVSVKINPNRTIWLQANMSYSLASQLSSTNRLQTHLVQLAAPSGGNFR